MTNRHEHRVSFNADFKELVRSAQKASTKMEDLFSEAFKFKNAGRSIKNLAKLNETLLEKEASQRKAIEKKLYRQRAIDQKRDGEERLRLEEEIAATRRKLQEKLGAAEKKQAEATLKDAEEKLELFEKAAENFTAELKESYGELEGIVQQLQGAEKDLSRIITLNTRSTEALNKMGASVYGDMLKGGEEFSDKMEDLFSHLGGHLTGSIDPAAIAKTVSAGVGKGLARMGDILGPKIGKGGALAFGAVGGLVTVLGALAGVLLDTDKRMKDFNKSAVGTYGSAGLAALGGGRLDKGLRILNHTVTDLTGNFGVNEQEALALFDSLDKGGLTLQRLTHGARSASAAQNELNDTLTRTYRVAGATGVGLSEYAQNLTDYVNDLGQSLDTVNDSFSQIARQASDSAFGTRRFYSMVVQASSGQASLNTRLEDTADLLMKMTKVLGAKKATEMAGQHASDMQGMGTQDRYRMILTTGAGRFRKNLAQDAGRQARSFAQDASGSAQLSAALTESGVGQALGDAITAAGGAGANPQSTQELVRQLASMGRDQQDALVASLTSRDDGLGRRLGQLVTVARGTNGGMAQMADAMSGMSSGGSIVARLQSAMAVIGRPLNELTGVERMAAEQITGTSGEQFEMLQKVAANASGQFAILKQQQRNGATMSEATRQDLATRFGATIDTEGTIRQARLDSRGQLQLGEEISSSNQMIGSYMERTGDDLSNIKTEQSALMSDTYDATVSIGDVLENKMLYYVRGLYEDVGMPILDAVSKFMGASASQVNTSSQIRRQVSLSVKAQQDILSERTRSLQAKKTQLSSTTDTSVRERLQNEIKQLESGVASARSNIEQTRAAGDLALANVGHAGAQGHSYEVAGRTYATWQEAQAAQAQAGRNQSSASLLADVTLGTDSRPEIKTQELDAIQLMQRAMRAVGSGGVPTMSAGPGATVTAPPPAPSREDVNPAATAQIANTTTAAAAQTAAAVADAGAAQRDHAETLHQQGQRNLQRVLTRETKLGDALARSALPDAIAEAQLKLQFEQMAYASGLNPEEVARATSDYMSQGTLSTELQQKLAASGDPGILSNLHLFGVRANELGTATGRRFGGRAAAATSADEDPEIDDGDAPVAVRRPHHDFVYQNRGGTPTITPIDREDQVVGSRPGGPVERAGGGGRAPVTIHINGGDERRVYEIVKRVMREAGVAPSRVLSNG